MQGGQPLPPLSRPRLQRGLLLLLLLLAVFRIGATT
jgi:hypothetical protein